MTDYDAMMIAEGVQAAKDDAQFFAAWQHLIDTGLAWRLQGFFGRTAAGLIELGQCHAKSKAITFKHGMPNNAPHRALYKAVTGSGNPVIECIPPH